MIAMLLTVDTNGNDATQARFDPTNIEQYGFEPQRDDLRGLGAYWGAGSLVAADGKTAADPGGLGDRLEVVLRRHVDTDHFIVDGSDLQRPDWNPDGVPFCNGKVAMAENFLWSTYCMTGAGDNWDVAAIPAYNGTQTARLQRRHVPHLEGHQEPRRSVQGSAVPARRRAEPLTQTYGAMPAREDLRRRSSRTWRSSFGTLQQPIDWQVVLDGIDHADVPNFESPLPSLPGVGRQRSTRIAPAGTRHHGLDMDQQIRARCRRSADNLEQVIGTRHVRARTPVRRSSACSVLLAVASEAPGAPRGALGLLFISPWLIGFVLFTLLPTLATLDLSFTNFEPDRTRRSRSSA